MEKRKLDRWIEREGVAIDGAEGPCMARVVRVSENFGWIGLAIDHEHPELDNTPQVIVGEDTGEGWPNWRSFVIHSGSLKALELGVLASVFNGTDVWFARWGANEIEFIPE